MLSTLLWEDAGLVAINKAPGVSLATGKSGGDPAVRRLLDSLSPEDRTSLWGESEDFHLVHRLDVGTSGVVLLARDVDAHAALVRAFSERLVRKTYLALVWGRPTPREGLWDVPIGPDREDRRKMKVDPSGKPARSGFATLATSPHASLLELHPETGRTHQLRVHCAHAGHPIVGDDFYGGPRHKGIRDQRLRTALQATHPLLHAARLHLPRTPLTAEIILSAPLPEDFRHLLAFLGMPLDA